MDFPLGTVIRPCQLDWTGEGKVQGSEVTDRVDTLVIGAGAVGLACARALAMRGQEVVILEAADRIGSGVSSRSSEVVHAGIYYATGSLRALLCVAGRRRLYPYCAERGVDCRPIGKLIVATEEAEVPLLSRLLETSRANGLTGEDALQRLDAAAVRRMEPEIRCLAALHSPSTGILDSHGYMQALLGDAENHGAALALHSRVTGVTRRPDGFIVTIDASGTATELECRRLINSAGLGAQEAAASMNFMPPALIPRRHLAKGCYFMLAGKSPFRHLVYPAPGTAHLGIHLTLDTGGQARFGPDVAYVDKIDYAVPPERAASFYDAVRRYWPGLPDGALQPGYAGVRPKIQAPGEPARDFLVQGPADHGIPGLVNLFGIESPGLTSSLALADYVAGLL
jgi:L-2-hydroxyglutarate oxidase LhgO